METGKQVLTGDASTWQNSSLVSVSEISTEGLKLLMKVSSEMKELVTKKGGDDRLAHHVLGTIFYEASTRTSCSFQVAMSRLGGKFVHVDASKSGSTSTKKGESLADTVRCIECYCDALVLRHFEAGSVPSVAQYVSKPLINAGDGVGEHPTQALLDVFTILDELQLTQGQHLTICLLGDLKHSRTVHSLVKLLAMSQGLGLALTITIHYCSPQALQMPPDLVQEVQRLSSSQKLTQTHFSDVNKAIHNADVLYVTRLQKERFASEHEYANLKGAYVVDTDLLTLAPKHMIVMHPLPRVDEISTEVDSDPRAAYFRQMKNGMYVRMAILTLLLGKY